MSFQSSYDSIQPIESVITMKTEGYNFNKVFRSLINVISTPSLSVMECALSFRRVRSSIGFALKAQKLFNYVPGFYRNKNRVPLPLRLSLC